MWGAEPGPSLSAATGSKAVRGADALYEKQGAGTPKPLLFFPLSRMIVAGMYRSAPLKHDEDFDMSLDPNPVFRKVIVPWYETKGVCYTLIVFTTLTLLFSGVGVSVALVNPAYNRFVWVPLLLGVLSALVIFSSARQILSFYMD